MTPLRPGLAAVLALTLALHPRVADACGCFTPPDPTVPVVQAGERILFSVKEGQVTAHVQIQYAGDAAEFGWLLPLPSVPVLELGVDELFTQLIATTQPSYRLQTRLGSDCFFGGTGGSGTSGGSGTAGGSASAGSGGAGGSSPLVVQDSVGPYDYAVLRADSKAEMLTWLAANRYFVPAGTDDSVGPYIRPGSYFLALKLRSGKSAGDLQPVVLRYPSDVGMIPIILTSTGAQQNMGVQVWMLGSGRAIPRNYHHTVVNDATIDWRSFGANYNDVIIRAAGEAPGRHTFVTEYAGTPAPMRGLLAPPSRFGTQAELAAQPTLEAFLGYLYARGFAAGGSQFGGLPSTVRAVLAAHLPPPPEGVAPDTYYRNIRAYLPASQRVYDPVALAAELFQRYVLPMRAASALFDEQPWLTRLYTTISPQDMNRDPVFSFNPELPAVGRVHQATMQVACKAGRETGALLTTEQGWRLAFPQGRFGPPALDPRQVPASLRIEVLAEEGGPAVLTDNQPMVAAFTASTLNQPPQGTVVPEPGAMPEQPPAPCQCASGPAGLMLLAAWLVLGSSRGRRRDRRTAPRPSRSRE